MRCVWSGRTMRSLLFILHVRVAHAQFFFFFSFSLFTFAKIFVRISFSVQLSQTINSCGPEQQKFTQKLREKKNRIDFSFQKCANTVGRFALRNDNFSVLFRFSIKSTAHRLRTLSTNAMNICLTCVCHRCLTNEVKWGKKLSQTIFYYRVGHQNCVSTAYEICPQ